MPYQAEGERQRHEYRLTTKGRDLYPTLVALMQWGDTYLADGPPPLELQHRDCGAPVHLELHCEAGHTRSPARARSVRSGGRPHAGCRSAQVCPQRGDHHRVVLELGEPRDDDHADRPHRSHDDRHRRRRARRTAADRVRTASSNVVPRSTKTWRM